MKHKNFKTQEDPFGKNAQGFSKIYQEVLLLMKFLKTKHQIRNLNINFYYFFYTVIKNRDDKVFVNDNYEDKEND